MPGSAAARSDRVILHDATLREIAARRCATQDVLGETPSLGATRLQAYGVAVSRVGRRGDDALDTPPFLVTVLRMNPSVDLTDELVERYRKITSATAYSGTWQLAPPGGQEWFASANYQLCLMRGVKQMTPGKKMVGRARTLRFVPSRPDLLKITRRGGDSPEYRAMARCGPGDVLVVEAHTFDEYACILGNMKTRMLWHQQAEGLVTDGAIRDLQMISDDYGLSVFAANRSPAGNLPFLEAYEENEPVNVGGVLVLPGDMIVADDDGVVVVPADCAEEVINWIEEQEEAEEWVIRLIDEERVPPGTYYPISAETKERFRAWKREQGEK